MATSLLQNVQKAGRIVYHRFRTQGFRTTLVWMYARGIPKVTGVPMVGYSRITQQVYLGAQYRRLGKRKLKRLGITGVVNMRVEFDDAAHNLTLDHYCYLPTIDDDAPSEAHLMEGVRFMNKVIAEGGKVYIHCAGGIGRAPTMAVAYLISHGFSIDEAIRLIQRTRSFIRIMPAQMEMLRRLEARQIALQKEMDRG